MSDDNKEGAGVPVGWQVRGIGREDGPGEWRHADSADLEAYRNGPDMWELRPVFATPPAVMPAAPSDSIRVVPRGVYGPDGGRPGEPYGNADWIMQNHAAVIQFLERSVAAPGVAIAAREQEVGWIDVRDRLPEPETEVLTRYRHPGDEWQVGIHRYCPDDLCTPSDFGCAGWLYGSAENVETSHWMPLPPTDFATPGDGK